MLPAEEIGFTRTDYSLITKEERIKVQTEIFELILSVLDDWGIVVKPHPQIKNFAAKKQRIESISPHIEVVDPGEDADKYIEMADVIAELPRPASTTLFSASLQCPEKPILALDLHHEFLGDCYRDFKGIAYIDSLDEFVSVLEKIRDNRYAKKAYDTDGPDVNCLSSTIEMLEYS